MNRYVRASLAPVGALIAVLVFMVSVNHLSEPKAWEGTSVQPYVTPDPGTRPTLNVAQAAATGADDCLPEVRDYRLGYYLSSGADATADMQAMVNAESMTTYRSLADNYTFPGWNKAWVNNLGPDVRRNFVLELKHYGQSNLGAQTFTVDGKSYTVPVPNMTIQQRPGTTWPKAYGYTQVTSGAIDGLLARSLAQIKTMPYNATLNIQLASEFDTDHEFGTTEAGVAYTWAQSDTRAIAALSYIENYLRSKGLPEGITLSIGMAGFDRAAYKRMHPVALADRFDVLQFNAYNHGSARTPVQVFSRTWDWAVADLAGTNWLDKPVMVAEWGTSAALGDQAGFISGVDEAILEINSRPGPDIVDANYFNSGWGKLDPKAPGLEALAGVAQSEPFID